jgi:hypothetical protein
MTDHVSLYRKVSLVLRSERLSEYDAAHEIHLPHYDEVGAATAVSQGQLQVFPDGLLPMQSRKPHAVIVIGATDEASCILI